MQKDKFWEDLKSGLFASMVRETSKGQTLSNSKEVYHVLKPLVAGHDDVEAVYGIFLTAKNQLLGIEKLFSGSLTGASVYPREIVKRVIELKASAVVLAHNHPSGCTEPSIEDKAITFRLSMALAAIDVVLHDHIIIGTGLYSMADAGVMATINSQVKKLLMIVQ
jgi:DNA repair protein RadC